MLMHDGIKFASLMLALLMSTFVWPFSGGDPALYAAVNFFRRNELEK